MYAYTSRIEYIIDHNNPLARITTKLLKRLMLGVLILYIVAGPTF